MTFDDCLAFVLQHEGPDTNDPHDPGGLTRFGIAQNSHPDVDVANLTKQGAADIYRSQYWTPTHCDALQPALALCVFDAAVNMGTHKAIVILQEALNVTADGIFGPVTLEAANTANLGDLVDFYHSRREMAYRATAGFDRYGHGWLNRNDDVLTTALSWIH